MYISIFLGLYYQRHCGLLKKNDFFRAQSFTSLKADLRQDINSDFAFRGALMEHFLEESAPLSLKTLVT